MTYTPLSYDGAKESDDDDGDNLLSLERKFPSRLRLFSGLACVAFGVVLCSAGIWGRYDQASDEKPDFLAFEAGMLDDFDGLSTSHHHHRSNDCKDSSFWSNGYNCRREHRSSREGCSSQGWTCEGYERQGWCSGGHIRYGRGAAFNYPEDNCCACGAEGTDASSIGSCREFGCHHHRQRHNPCQCNPECVNFGSCCSDYREVCLPTPPPTPPRTTTQPPSVWSPANPSLLQPSAAPSLTFYMYRAQTLESFPPTNVNTASLGAVLWYLHNEVVTKCPRRGTIVKAHDISRIIRYKVTTKAPQPLFERGMNFGVKCSYDFGACTGPENRHGEDWAKYGYFVGCNVVGHWPHESFSSALNYPQPYWYSLPGVCPNEDIKHKSPRCQAAEPGGHCENPDGRGDCTYSFEEAGEIQIDELVGITPRWPSHDDFCAAGCKEYVEKEDKGHCIAWWNGKNDKARNAERVRRADEMFAMKFPNLPRDKDMPPPPCDFNKGRFYDRSR